MGIRSSIHFGFYKLTHTCTTQTVLIDRCRHRFLMLLRIYLSGIDLVLIQAGIVGRKGEKNWGEQRKFEQGRVYREAQQRVFRFRSWGFFFLFFY